MSVCLTVTSSRLIETAVYRSSSFTAQRLVLSCVLWDSFISKTRVPLETSQTPNSRFSRRFVWARKPRIVNLVWPSQVYQLSHWASTFVDNTVVVTQSVARFVCDGWDMEGSFSLTACGRRVRNTPSSTSFAAAGQGLRCYYTGLRRWGGCRTTDGYDLCVNLHGSIFILFRSAECSSSWPPILPPSVCRPTSTGTSYRPVNAGWSKTIIPLIRIDCDWFFSGILDICFGEHGHNEQSMARTMADLE